jgi:hypothetical protein
MRWHVTETPPRSAACVIRPRGRKANANVTAPLHDRDRTVTPQGQVVSAHCGRDRRRRSFRRLQVRGLRCEARRASHLSRFLDVLVAGTEGVQGVDIAPPGNPRPSLVRRGGWGPVPLRARPAPRCGSRAGRCQQRDQHNLRAILGVSKTPLDDIGSSVSRGVPLLSSVCKVLQGIRSRLLRRKVL